MFEGFAREWIETDEAEIHLVRGGKGPPLLLLHGYPQSHVIWHAVAPRLAERFALVIPDLRGYGDSTGPAPDAAREAGRRERAAMRPEGPLAGEVAAIAAELDPAGQAVGLAQLALRLTAPGVPDLYQGSESWLRTLVDPDNRADLDPDALRAAIDDPGPKTALIMAVLGLRRNRADCFGPGSSYEALRADGRLGDHVVAFARRPPGAGTSDGVGGGVLTVAARFPASRPGGWHGTTLVLPPGFVWRDALTGRTFDGGPVGLEHLLGDRPAAVLGSETGPVAR